MAFPIKLIFVLVLYARSFLHQEGFGENKNVGFRELVLALASTPYETIFATEFVKTLVEHFWARY